MVDGEYIMVHNGNNNNNNPCLHTLQQPKPTTRDIGSHELLLDLVEDRLKMFDPLLLFNEARKTVEHLLKEYNQNLRPPTGFTTNSPFLHVHA